MKEIKLTNSDKVALVDDEDFDFVNRHRWQLKAGKWAYNSKIDMHHFILGSKPQQGLFIDHKDRNGLNNQKSNLRWATKGQNACNSEPKKKHKKKRWSNFKGVGFHEVTGLWTAECRFNGVKKSAYFKTELEAAHGYDKLALELQGEFAYLNFPKLLD